MGLLQTYKIDDTIVKDFTTHNPVTGAVSDADVTPTCEVFEDTNDSEILTPTCTKRTAKTGNYRLSIDITVANGFEIGKNYNVIVSATVGGITAKSRIDSFLVDANKRPEGAVVADVTNTVSVFKTDLASVTDDFYADMFLVFIDGALKDQVRKVMGYNGTTKFVTCIAFTSVPVAATNFVLIGY